MSASLVGSEMCIRDRLIPPGPPTDIRRPFKLQRLLSRGGHDLAQLRCQTCLLYTSDAADDM
eukprot:5304137-Alexandrium_andersonii.AAC.1